MVTQENFICKFKAIILQSSSQDSPVKILFVDDVSKFQCQVVILIQLALKMEFKSDMKGDHIKFC